MNLDFGDQRAENPLGGALDRADQAISEGRDAITDLRASSLASRDLEKSITAPMTNLSEDLAAGNGRSVTFCVLVEGVPRAVRPTLQDEIYRIARESFRNAIRHAQAGRNRDGNHLWRISASTLARRWKGHGPKRG